MNLAFCILVALWGRHSCLPPALQPALRASASQSAVPQFRSDVSLVRAEAVVIDGNRLVTGLHKEDFRLLDNRQEQTVQYFSEDEEPLDILLLFDVSGSMRSSMEAIAASAGAAFRQLIAGDRVAVMTFANRPRLVTPLTADLEAAAESVRSNILEGKGRGGTEILKGADAAAKYLMSGHRDRRRAVLIITDNEGFGARREKSVVRNYWEADATLSAVLVSHGKLHTALRWYSRVSAPYMLAFAERINGVVNSTGGELIKSDDPAAAFAELIGRIRRRYCLYYRPPEAKPGEERGIRVELAALAKQRMPNARVLARTGYIAGHTTGNKFFRARSQ